MIVSAVVFRQPARIVDFRFGILLVTVLLALIIGGIGVARGQRSRAHRGQRSRAHIGPGTRERPRARIAEIADAEHAMAEGEATRDQEAKVIEDAARRSRERRGLSWARAEPPG